LLGIVEPGDELVGLDAVALGNEALRHAAGDFEAELRIRHLDVAGENEVAGVDAMIAGTGAEQQRGADQDAGQSETGSVFRKRNVFHRQHGDFHSRDVRWP
jgi:hypothetical protein